MHTSLALAPEGTVVDLVSGRGRRAGEDARSAEDVHTLADILDAHGGPKNIPLEDAWLLMELPGNSLTMLSASGDDIMILGFGTHPLLHYLRESQIRLCPHGGLRSIPIVLLLIVVKVRLASSDALDLTHFGVLLYRTGQK